MKKIDTKFKQTNIGPIPEEWDVLPIFDLADWINGSAYKNEHFVPIGKPVIKINELKYGITEQTQFTQRELDKKYFLKKGDLLFSWSGSPDTSIDAFWYDLPEGLLNQHIFKVLESSKISREYLYYIFKANKARFVDIAKDKQTTGLGHVTIRDLKSFDVPLPPLPEQSRIASILSSLDDKIELNRKINANLERIASALFKRWFVDFEFPDKNGRPYKSNGGKLVESELGEIPEGWRVGRLGDLVVNISDRFVENNSVVGLPYVPIDKIDAKSLALSIIASPDEAQSSLIKFQKDDILFGAMRPYFHKVAISPFEGLTRTTCFIFRAVKKEFFAYSAMAIFSSETVDFAASHAEGSTIPYAKWRGCMDKMPILFPNESSLIKFNELIYTLLKNIRDSYFENHNLQEVRDSLLPRLMNGRIRVRT